MRNGWNSGGLRFGTHLLVSVLLGAMSTTCVVPAEESPPERAVEVRVDRRVELMSIAFRMAGHPEYDKGRGSRYIKAVDERFGEFRDDPLMDWIRQLRRTRGVSYDAPMSMAVHLTHHPTWQLRCPVEPHPSGLDRRWQAREAEIFVERLNAFVEKSRFEEFFEANQPLYDLTETRMRALLEEETHLEWFDEFFGSRPAAQFTVIPALLNGGQCYGPHVTLPDGSEELYCVLGVWMTDYVGRPRFDTTVVDTIIHEFCHSYTNSIVDRHEEALRPSGEAIFPHVADVMRKQAYGNWKTMMYESLVRASVIRYLAKHSPRAIMLREIGRQNQRGFVWVEDLAGLLAEYEQQRDKYATLDSFAPEIVAFFEDYAREFEAQGDR